MYQRAIVIRAAMSSVRTCGRASAEIRFVSLIRNLRLQKLSINRVTAHYCKRKSKKGKGKIENEGRDEMFLTFSFLLFPAAFHSRRTCHRSSSPAARLKS